MLTVGDKFPEFKLKATVGIDSLDTAFKDIDNTTYKRMLPFLSYQQSLTTHLASPTS